MKTYFSSILFVFYSLFVFSQNNNKINKEVSNSHFYLPLIAIFPNIQLSESYSIVELQEKLKKVIPTAYQSEFKLIQASSSSYSNHYLFQQLVEHELVYNSCVKVNIDKHNKIYSVYYALADVSKKLEVISNTLIPINDAIHTHKKVWTVKNDRLEEMILKTTKDPLNSIYREELLSNGNIVYSIDLNSYAAAHDTIIQGYIHYPDPITTSLSVYGGALIDRNDSTNSILNSKRSLVSIRAIDSLGIFYLKSPYCEIVEIDPPVKNPVNSVNGNFLYNRFEDGFEDFNVFYHINHFHDYLKDTLGFELVNYPISCDVHALNGTDNSLFTFSTSPPSLHLGEGGVDDAEDADVIIHEYCHAVSHDAAPFTNVGTERNSLDEGFCDYLACSYSKSINPYKASWVFNWDGHNEFWAGRIVNDTKLYPSDITANIYTNGGIWSSALWEIEEKLGREKGNKLAIQTMYDNAINMSLEQAAMNYVMADSILYGGADYCLIVHSMLLRGLLPATYQLSCDFTHVITIPESIFSISNSLEFAQGTGSLFIHSKDLQNNIIYELADMQGNIIQRNQIQQSLYAISSESLSPGMYTLILRTNNELKTFKLLKY